jgi:arginine decarboxylase (EC 4.1.1.19)
VTTIHITAGIGRAPTAMAAYDAALADANLHNYNLVSVSSIIPAEATIEVVDRVPDLGPAGNRLTVVEGTSVVGPDESADTAATAIAWATGPGPGLFYEASGTDPDAVEREARRGLDAGSELRDWELPDSETLVSAVEVGDSGYTAAVVIAAYGDSEPIC